MKNIKRVQLVAKDNGSTKIEPTFYSDKLGFGAHAFYPAYATPSWKEDETLMATPSGLIRPNLKGDGGSSLRGICQEELINAEGNKVEKEIWDFLTK